MSDIAFADLLEIYRNVQFDQAGDGGLLTIASQEILDLLLRIDGDDKATNDAGITSEDDPTKATVGGSIRVRIGPPRIALGILARTFDDLLNAPKAVIEEPPAYFIINGKIDKTTDPAPKPFVEYRKTLEIYKLLAEAASYADVQKPELVFIEEDKFLMPVRYRQIALFGVETNQADRLLMMFGDELHRDEKLTLLGKAVVGLTKAVAKDCRFTYLLGNIKEIADEVLKGYQLYVSQFSYTKIKSDVEASRVDFVTKIHKTIIDIQAQLLGIPIATFIVASQLKDAAACGASFWGNLAVLAGAWIFVGLLVVAIVNQWMTLGSINWEIERQRKKVVTDFIDLEILKNEFLGIFDGLLRRICWHRVVLFIIGALAFFGAIMASIAYANLTTISPTTCIGGKLLSGQSATPTDQTKSQTLPSAASVSPPPLSASPSKQVNPNTGAAPAAQ